MDDATTQDTAKDPMREAIDALYQRVEKAWLEQLLAAAKQPVDAKVAIEVLHGLASARCAISRRETAHEAFDNLLRRSERILSEGLARGRFTGDEAEAAGRVQALFRQALGG